ncbi:hypothetical protein CLIM01_02359 [Colletotrichum limetticola]|uniref:Uncharacterized protein n=1 Tax=Colletotrichum limetticola TaxID=1209924 RepID=A0ABQ9Q911_9PEZI|nr:hypothetical protein CLIM01_02359 [Colletotrichum limetticola]
MRRCAFVFPEMFLGARGEKEMAHQPCTTTAIPYRLPEYNTADGTNWHSSILFLFVQPSTHARPIPSHRASALLHLINPKYGDRPAVSILRDVSIGKDAEDDSFDRPPRSPFTLTSGLPSPVSNGASPPSTCAHLHLRIHRKVSVPSPYLTYLTWLSLMCPV